MHFFSQALNNGGYLILSGFYEKDMPIVEKHALQNNLKFVSFNAKNNWVSMIFCK
jgi:ribosomal protein L11 methyltransferase